MTNLVVRLQIDQNFHFFEYLSISFFSTLFFYRLHKLIVDENTNIDRVGYVDSKYTIFVFKLILFTVFNIFLSSHISKS
jgi:hypothetical protein